MAIADELAHLDDLAVAVADRHRGAEALLCRGDHLGTVELVALAGGVARLVVGAHWDFGALATARSGGCAESGRALERDIDGGADQRRAGDAR